MRHFETLKKVSHLSHFGKYDPYADGSIQGLENRSKSLTLSNMIQSETRMGHRQGSFELHEIMKTIIVILNNYSGALTILIALITGL